MEALFSFKLMNGDTIPDIEHLLLMTLLLQHFGTERMFDGTLYGIGERSASGA